MSPLDIPRPDRDASFRQDAGDTQRKTRERAEKTLAGECSRQEAMDMEYNMKANVVIDIEMCIVQKEYRWKDYPYEHEIIQIGAVMMDEAFEITDEFSSYVCPKYGRIDHFIQDLTGIGNKEIREAPSLKEALEKMVSWLAGYEVTFYSWSRTDYIQLSREISAKGIDEEKMAVLLDKERWVDYQQTAGKRFDKPWRMSLEDALMFAEVELEGKQHDGLADARNTARLIAKMEKNPDSHFLQDTLRDEKEKNGEPIGTSLGNLLGRIKL